MKNTLQPLTQSWLPWLAIALACPLSAFAEPKPETNFFNGKDFTGWKGEMEFWSVKDGVIVGHSDEDLPNNKFLWSDVEVGDFYFSVDVRMPINERNAGIQFRSKPTETPNLQAVGYQADAGKNVWGRLYHEHGRGKLDWTNRGEAAVKPGEWNRYEILAVGNRIWTAINGQLSVAIHDQAGGELRGQIALQIHSGQAQTVEYKINQLVHDPKVELAGMNEEELNAAADAKTLKRKPNFIVIFTDDQGYDDLGCFGSETIKTPHIDRMAKEGRKFTNFVVPQSICTPSRAALLTGSYAKRSNMHQWVLLPESDKGLHPDEHTIADQLKGQGYSTTCIGKWHLGHHKETLPHRNGFDSFFGIPYSNDMNHPDNQGKPKMDVKGLDIQWKDPESTLTMWKTPLMQNDEIIELPVDQRTITRRYTDKTIEFIKRNQEKPFFVYLPHSMPHVPLYVPEDFYNSDPKQAYIKTMEHIDAEVGRILDTLRETGLDEHTYVIFTSDNGPAIGNQHHGGTTGGLRGGKTTTWEGGTRVPCIVWGPGRIPANTTSDELWSTIDFLPTIASLADSDLPKNRKIDGLDVSALLTDAAAKSPRSEILYYDGHGNLEGIRKDQWKLLRKKNQTLLFDLAKDVNEENNLTDPNADVVAELARRMKVLGDEVDDNARPAWVKKDDLATAPALIDFDASEEILPNVVDSESARLVPSGVGGQALQLDGRQTRLELSPALNWQVDKKPFTISAWVKPDSLRQAGILCAGGYGWRHGWLLDMHPDGSIRFETSNRENKSNGSVKTKPGALKVGQWTHLAVAVHGNQWADVFVDGKLVAKEQLKGIDLANSKAKLVIGGIETSTNHNFHGTIDQVQIFAGNAQSPPEIASHYQPIRSRLGTETGGNGAVKRFSGDSQNGGPTQPFADGKFTVEPNEMIVFMGQTDMVRSRLDGTLESIIAAEFAGQKPRFRNMAWESDTVYEQWRDIDFGSWTDQLNAAGATMVIAQFGQIEALDGAGRVEEFVAAYEKLFDEVSQRTRRLVLISPRPFEKPISPHMPDHTDKNEVLREYSDLIQKFANSRGAIFVNLFSPPASGETLSVTTNGIHVTDENQPVVAHQIAAALDLPTADPSSDLRAAVNEKSRLWYDNWRPMNWSFAFGDRTSQMFSKAGGDRPPLKVEIEDYKVLLEEADDRVHQVALGRTVEIPSAPAMEPSPAPPGDHSVEAQLASFKVKPGFSINLFASEADGIVKPVQMRWDDRGRLWVICTPTYPHIKPGLRPGDYIMVCEDTDGDGKADKFDRFAEGLFIPMGLEFGDGSLYITEATELVHLKDTDNDGKADKRTVILSGFGTADSHQMINGLERGPLGDFWFTQGHHAYSRVETPWGISKLEKSGVWRYRPATGRLDGFFNKSVSGLNCQGVTHDDWGQTFHNSAAGSGGFYTTPGAIATDRTRKLKELTASPSRNTGIEFIGSSHLPEDMQGQVVWGAFMSNSIELRKASDDGSGFAFEKMPDLVQSDRQEFRPVNTRVGPDGAIYVADWYNLTIGHYQASYADPMRDRTHGRIWRITANDRPLLKAPDLDGLRVEELVELLNSPERLTRANAKKRLFDLPSKDVLPVIDRIVDNLDATEDNYASQLYDLAGVLAGHEAVRPKVIEAMINADEPRVRAIGARLIGRWANRLENSLELLSKTAVDEHPRVRMESIVAATQIPSPESIKIATKTLDLPTDRFLDHAFYLAVHALQPHWMSGLESGELNFDENPNHLSAILEIDSGGSVELVRKLAQSKQPEHLALLARIGSPDDLKFAFQHGNQSSEVLQALLDVARLKNKKPGGDLKSTLTEILDRDNSTTTPLAISLAGAWKIDSLSDQVKSQLSADNEAVQQAAIETILSLRDSPEHREAVEELASADSPNSIQAAAIRALATVDPQRSATLTYQLLPTITKAEQLKPLMAALMEGQGRGKHLAEAIREKPHEKETLTRVQQAIGLTGQTSPSLQAAINAAMGVTSKAPMEYDEAYTKTVKALVESSGNFERGKLVYQKAGTCIGCHKIEGVGGDIGPDLTEVGSGRSFELLIESVLWPNRQIREGFMTTRITTKDDQLHTGYKLSEKNGTISLRDIATPKVKKIARAEIQKEEEAGSAMVAGLTTMLTDAELADMIAYLAGLKKK